MWQRSMVKIAIATAVYGAVHSALATLFAKHRAARLFGDRTRNGLYRAFYIVQSFVTISLLMAYAWPLPHRQLYRIDGRPAKAMHAGEAAAFVYATWAASQLGIRRITGLGNITSWLLGRRVEPEPEAQGPALDAEGCAKRIGPFAFSRHPLNFVPVVVLWLWPRMNTNLLAFNLVATLYLVLGSAHEESRLRRVYGALYAAYQHRGVAFYVPRPTHAPMTRTTHFLAPEGEVRYHNA